MELVRIKKDLKPETEFYEGIKLSEYQELTKREEELFLLVHECVTDYLEDVCGGDNIEECISFPCLHCLTRNYYISEISFFKLKGRFGISIFCNFTRLFEMQGNIVEGDYLGLEVWLELDSLDSKFVFESINESVI